MNLLISPVRRQWLSQKRWSHKRIYWWPA